jgi:peptidoglycan/xylan/chitin deacetylase (PgdA/CDA1 family)
VVEHYGIKTLLYGVLLPGPDIGKQAAAEMRAIDQAGHEAGIHAWDHVAWHDQVRFQNPEWTKAMMQKSWDRFIEIFGHQPTTYGAAGWQMNEAALEQLDEWGIKYSSDGRAEANLLPYRLALATGKAKHVQYPSTLPTLDELIGVDDADEFGAVDKLLAITQSNPNDQVFTLHAELEGQKLLPAFEKLIMGWLNQGHELVTMGELHQSWEATKQLDKIAVLPLTWGQIPNRSGDLIIQNN